jgi:CBS domain-containing protein
MATLSVRRRYVLAGDGVQSIDLSVWCPERQQSLSLDVCASCEHLDAITTRRTIDDKHGYLACSPPVLREAKHKDTHVDVQEAAARALVTNVMRTQTICVRTDATVESIAAVLLSEGLRCVVVVDADTHPLGIVSKSDLLRDRMDHTGESRTPPEDGFHVEDRDDRVASDVMTPFVHALPEKAPLTFAIALMASEGLLEVPVVDEGGAVIGLVTALDALQWLARRFGYVFDPKTLKPS